MAGVRQTLKELQLFGNGLSAEATQKMQVACCATIAVRCLVLMKVMLLADVEGSDAQPQGAEMMSADEERKGKSKRRKGYM